MFKASRWRNDKKKIKIVYKLQFQAAQVPLPGSEAVTVSLVPLDVGKPTVRSERVSAVGGNCNWLNPIYETVKLVRDPKSGKINEKLYKFIVSTAGSDRAGLLGEATINLADYAEVFQASSVSLPLKGGAALHVTIQRIQGNVGGREAEHYGDATLGQGGGILNDQLRESNNEEGVNAFSGWNDTNLLKEGLYIDKETRSYFQSSRNLPTYADSGCRLNESHSADAISVATSDSSSGIYNPRGNSLTNGSIQKDSTLFLSPLAKTDIGPKLIRASGDLTGTSAPDRSIDGSTNSSGESGLIGFQCSDDTIEKILSDVYLARKLEVSELEMQTLRRQIVKENRRGQDLSREISSLKEERDALRRECEELKSAQKKTNESQCHAEDPSSDVEEIKQELDYEKNLNSSLRLQLQKTQEANSELLLAVRDLDDLLEQRNLGITPCHRCSKMDVKVKADQNDQGMEHGNRYQQLQQLPYKQELLQKISEKSKYALDILLNEHNHMNAAYALEKKIVDLNSEIELYKKNREDIEMQMEQLALDYEILKQEKHEVTYKLEQTQLREQLRMQYECSAHSAIINELEAHVECLEKELHKQPESFESDIDSIMKEKIEQEKKVIQAEEALRTTKWNNLSIAERLHDELARLSSQASSVLYDNEKIVKQALKEAIEVRLQRSHLEKMLEKTKENLAFLESKYSMNVRQLLGLLNFKSKETEKLQLELKTKNEELASYKFQEARLKDPSEKIQLLQTEIGKLKMEKYLISEQKEKLVADIKNMDTTNQGNKIMLQNINSENEILKEEILQLKQQVENSLEEINNLRNMRDEKENMIILANSDTETSVLEYNNLKRSLSEGETKKEKLRRLVSNLTGGLLKEESTITMSKEEDNNGYVNGETRLVLSSSHMLKDRTNEVEDMDNIEEKHCHRNSKHAGTSEFQIDVDIIQPRVGDKLQINDTVWKGQEFVIRYAQDNSEEPQHITTCTCDQDIVSELLCTMAVLKEQNESMEADLKQLQERYSEISLKFAEVEGERQQLVMTIRTLKNALKS